jgi:hypothetical protein
MELIKFLDIPEEEGAVTFWQEREAHILGFLLGRCKNST